MKEDKMKDLKIKMAIALNNGAIEQELLGNINEAMEGFFQAYKVSESCSGSQDF